MPLPAIATPEIYDNLPEAVQELYGEPDSEGNRIAQIEGLDQHPEKSGLLSAYGKVKKSLDDTNQKVSRLQSDLTKASAQSAKAKEAADSESQSRVRDLEGALEKALQEADSHRQALDQWQIKSALDAELQRNNVTSPGLRRAAVAELISRASIKDGEVFVEDGYSKPVSDFIAKWSSSDGADFVSQPTGGGAKPGNGKVTVTKEQFDAMPAIERTQLYRTDPNAFERLSTNKKE